MQNKINKLLIYVIATAMVVTGCTAGRQQTQQNGQQRAQQRTQSVDVVNFQVGNDEVVESRSPVVNDLETGMWIPLKDAAEAFGFTTAYDKNAGTYSMGYTDIMFAVAMNNNQGTVGEDKVQLSQAPKLIGGQPYITTKALSELWQTPIELDEGRRVVRITPIDDELGEAEGEQANIGQPGEEAVEDDPETTEGADAPAANEQAELEGIEGDQSAQRTQGAQGTAQGTQRAQNNAGIQNMDGGQFGALAMKNINMNALIRYGNRFLGTPYKWGSSRHTTKTFDCSSFVKRVYGKFGVTLPRGARDQSKRGFRVAYKNMKKGDLMFFWIKKRRTVGHVGIYAGNGRVLHTFGKGGVRYSNVRSGYWRHHFYFAKRVAR